MERLMFLLSGEHLTLPAAEAIAAIKAEHRAYKVIEQLDQVLIAESRAKPDVLAGRLGMCREICWHLCTSDVDEVLDAVGSSDIVDLVPHGRTFAVRVRRVKRHSSGVNVLKLAREIADLIASEVEFRVDLVKPDVEILGVLTDNRCVIGLTAARVDRAQFSMRRPTMRAAFHPGTLMPLLARCMVNLARTPRKGTLLDPFCLSPNTKVLLANGGKTLDELENCWRNERIMAYNGNGLVSRRAIRYIKVDPREHCLGAFILFTEGGREICATGNHAFYTPREWIPLRELRVGDKVAVYPRMDPERMYERDASSNEPSSADYFQRPLPKSGLKGSCDGAHGKFEMNTPAIQTRTDNDPKAGAFVLSEGDVRKAIPPHSDHEYILQILKSKGLVPLAAEDERLLILSRLLGHLFTDGYLLLRPRMRKEFYRKRNGDIRVSEYEAADVRIGFITGIEEDLKAIELDLEQLGFVGSKSAGISIQRIDGREFRSRKAELKSSSKPLWVLFRALGAPVGDKTRTQMAIPLWLHKVSPLARREFLRGLFGGDGSKIKVRIRKRKNYPDNEGISAPYLTFRKIEQLKNHGMEYARQITKLLGEFGVGSKIRCYENIGTQRKDGYKTITFRVSISETHRSIYNFCTKIGYSYARDKDLGTMFVGEYLRMREKTSTLGDSWSVRKGKVLKFSDWLKEATAGLNGGLVWDTVKSIYPKEISDVRDLTVEGEHNFIANGFLVHNCGVGGILIEAGLIGAKPIGVDIDREMIEGARRNLEAGGIFDYQLMVGDARHLPMLQVDAIATDPPFGRQATTAGVPVEELYKQALPSIAGVLKRKGYVCIASPASLELEAIAEEAGLRLIERHEQRVHKNLTRLIYVFRRK